MYTNKDAQIIDKPTKVIRKGEFVEVLDELEEAFVVRYKSWTHLLRKEDLVYDKGSIWNHQTNIKQNIKWT